MVCFDCRTEVVTSARSAKLGWRCPDLVQQSLFGRACTAGLVQQSSCIAGLIVRALAWHIELGRQTGRGKPLPSQQSECSDQSAAIKRSEIERSAIERSAISAGKNGRIRFDPVRFSVSGLGFRVTASGSESADRPVLTLLVEVDGYRSFAGRGRQGQVFPNSLPQRNRALVLGDPTVFRRGLRRW